MKLAKRRVEFADRKVGMREKHRWLPRERSIFRNSDSVK